MLIRSCFILLLTLMAGLALNPLLPDGIHWRFLRPTLIAANDGFKRIDAPTAFAMRLESEMVVVDVREAEAYRIDRIPGAVSLPWEAFWRPPRNEPGPSPPSRA